MMFYFSEVLFLQHKSSTAKRSSFLTLAIVNLICKCSAHKVLVLEASVLDTPLVYMHLCNLHNFIVVCDMHEIILCVHRPTYIYESLFAINQGQQKQTR